MAFADEKVKETTKRFMLIRLEPARYIGGDLSLSAGVYTMTFPYFPSRIQRNGTDLTEDSTTPTVNDHWYFDELTNTLEIKLASAPDADTNVITAYYHIFLTDDKDREAYEDPENSSTPLRLWENRILSSPGISQSVANIFTGTFSISASSLVIANNDYDFNQYLAINDSFRNKEIKIWIGLTNTDNLQKLFVGKISNLTVGNDRITLNILDTFSRLREPAFMGDTADEAYFSDRTGSFPNMHPPQDGEPCRYIIKRSRFRWLQNRDIIRYNGASLQEGWTLNHEACLESICTNFGGYPTGTNNREWGICRTSPSSFKTLDFGTPSSVLVSGTGVFYDYHSQTNRAVMSITTTTDHNIEVGDTFKATDSADTLGVGTTLWCTVTRSHNNFISCMINNANPPGSLQDITATTSFTANQGPGLVIHQVSDNTRFFPVYERDFTVSISATSGGNYYMEVNFVNNFESNQPTELGLLDPSSDHKIYFRATEETSSTDRTTHGKVVERLCQEAGLAIDSTSITTADSSLTAGCVFSIPQFDELDYDSNLDYLELVLGSTLGYILLANDFEVEYKLFSTPNSSDVRNNNLILRRSLTTDINYEDIVTQLIAYNPHSYFEYTNSTSIDSSVTETNNKAKYLHDIENTDRFRHVLDDMTSRLADIMALKANRLQIYSFSVATEDLDSEIGDDIQLEHDGLLGSITSKDCKIIGIQKSTDAVEIEAVDLEGL